MCFVCSLAPGSRIPDDVSMRKYFVFLTEKSFRWRGSACGVVETFGSPGYEDIHIYTKETFPNAISNILHHLHVHSFVFTCSTILLTFVHKYSRTLSQHTSLLQHKLKPPLQLRLRSDIMETAIIVCLVFAVIIVLIGVAALIQIGISRDPREKSMAILPK